MDDLLKLVVIVLFLFAVFFIWTGKDKWQSCMDKCDSNVVVVDGNDECYCVLNKTEKEKKNEK